MIPIKCGNVEIIEIDKVNRSIKAVVYIFADETMPVAALHNICNQHVCNVISHYLVPEGFLDSGTIPWQLIVHPIDFNNYE